ncbi:type IV toxin-antitoxin system AbiEi family antitoxin domain-containing protein [Longimicrobium sp.]|jgi:predicted transcriptional regulator of viral defense system|uniref:type IV toxin-antitoxin system AbiEi family antitoxin domain-containing protein n=1 Tax=Longimicrobium sp. TaxID=2029185 RepID=UPI002EDB5908
MPGERYNAVYELAVENFGYFTIEQATEANVSRKALNAMTRRGTLERVSTGLYRVPAIPLSPFSEYMEASLWPRGLQAIISHDSALVLHQLSDVNPARIHITVPKRHRIQRAVPKLYNVHRADLDAGDVGFVEGIPVTTPVRTIVDCHRAHLGAALVEQAIEDGIRRGVLKRAEAQWLTTECLGRKEC